jgi:riboflavin synthase
MFTGIIESTGRVTKLVKEGDNLHISIASDIAQELKIDQSIAHDGVCLTVVAIDGSNYTVTAIEETLNKTKLRSLKENDFNKS